MTKENLGLPSASKASTYQQNREKLEYPAGYAFMSKTEIKRAYDALLRENENLKKEERIKLEKNLLLERELYQNEIEINRQKKEIIDLYGRLNKDKEYNAIMVAG
jgi:hypothetical protein